MDSQKHHSFQFLDGLRGLVALAVVVFHRRIWFGSYDVFGHAYLGVDFFFMLSGFVLASAYQHSLVHTMRFGEFLKKRLIRLYPLVILGTVLGALAAAGKIHSGKAAHDSMFAVNVLATSLTIPNFWESEFFAYDKPLWSLFWEMLGSILFGLFGARLKSKYLIAIVIAAEICSISAQLYYHSFMIGYAPRGFCFGLARVIFPMGTGILAFRLYTSGRFANFRLGILAPILLLASFQMLPYYSHFNIIYNNSIIVLLYPLILFGSARHKPKFPQLNKVSGALSYPLYVLHEPLLLLISAALIVTHVSAKNSGAGEGVLRILCVMGISWLALKYMDEPIRKWLSRISAGGLSTQRQSTQPSWLQFFATRSTSVPAPSAHAAVSDDTKFAA